MPFTYSFQKILELKEREKEEKEQAYHQSMEHFEREASTLYELLKQKEQMEELYKGRMTSGISIHELQQNEKLLFHLQQKIHVASQKTDMARNRMAKREEEMQHAFMEWKKFEKVKEWKKEEYEEHIKKEEMKWMDELSTRNIALR